jgi:integrase
MSVHRRGDRWVAKVWADRGWRWIGTYSTRKEARAAEQAARPSRAWGITVDAFCERWLRDYARPALSTRRNNRYSLNAFRRDFGSRRLDSIERPEAQRWALRVPYTSYRTVRTMYADALRDGVIGDNPFSRLRIPAPQGRRRLDVLSEADVLRLADCALEVHAEPFGATVRAVILVAGFVGLRAGEVGGLEWGDVDLRRGELHVVRSIAPEGIKPPKNGEPRICVLPPPAAKSLADLDRHAGESAVFLTPRGHRYGKAAAHRYFVPVRVAFGRPRLQFHELRHACATLLLERGLTPEDVALQLGHRDGGGLVRRLYGHPAEDRARERIAMAFAEVPSEPVANRSQSGD